MPRGVYRRGGVWWISYTLADGEREREPTRCRTASEAATLRAERQVNQDRIRKGMAPSSRNPEGLTFHEAVVDWAKKKSKGTASHAKNVSALKHLLEWDLANEPLEAITTGRINAFLLAKEKAGLAPQTVNHLRMFVSRVFGYLIDLERWHGENPAARAKKRDVGERAPRMVPPSAVKALIRAAPSTSWRLAFALASYAGMRRSEIARLTWRAVDLTERLLVVEQTKTNRERTVAVHPELLALLRDHVGAPGALVVETDGGKVWELLNDAAETVRATIAAAGLTLDVSATFHGLRHTWASRMVAVGAHPNVIEAMGWGGKGSTTRLRVYTHHDADTLRRNIDLLSYPEPPTAAGVVALSSRRSS